MSARRVFAKLLALPRKRRLDRDLDGEIRAHLELAEHDALARGLSPQAARREARLRFGGIEQMKEEHRDRRGIRWLETLARDFRYNLASLRRAPGFTLVVIGMLALGIGASTAIFSVADAVLLRPLPYPNPGQIVRIWEVNQDGHRVQLANLNFDDFRAQNDTFAELAQYYFLTASVSGGSRPVRVKIASVSRGFFKIFGVEPFRGRLFDRNERIPHGAPAVVVSYNYWQNYLGGASDISQFHLRLEGGLYSVVGVMPPGFDFPRNVAVWFPSELQPDRSYRTAHNWNGIGRVRNGITVAQARANLSVIAHRIRERFGSKKVDLIDAAVVPLADAMVGEVRPALLTLLGAVSLLLLVACANVAGLLLARTSARRKELAVRVALGAGRGRLMQQFLAESFLLSAAAGALGILLAAWAVKIFPAIIPTDLPRQQGIAISAPVLLFAVVITVGIAVLLGLFAALRAGGGDLQQALSAGSRSYAGSNHRIRTSLVVGEIALTLVILAGAGLLGRSFYRLVSTNPGFQAQDLITLQFLPATSLIMDRTAVARQIHLFGEIIARLRRIPGAERVAWAGTIPVAAGDNLADGDFLILNGEKPPANFQEWARIAQNSAHTGHALYAVVGPEYFRTLGIPLIRGRAFTAQDRFNTPNVAVISEALARQRWPHQNPIGMTIDFGNMDGHLEPQTIVGIVGDVRARGLNLPADQPIIYVDYRQRGMNINASPTILMRTTASPVLIDSSARRIFHHLAPDVPVKFATFADEMGGWLSERRFLLLLVGLFAGAGLALAAIGIYGVVAFSVARRTQEIGIRMALGAQRSDVLRLVIGEGARMAVLGVVIGIAVSLAVTRLLSSLLFGIGTTDPLTFIGVAVLLAFVALAASYIPARRAMRVDPMTALRYE
ncbi:MAG TPA: ABC transporter permease [Bryobacteraceae bacterium]